MEFSHTQEPMGSSCVRITHKRLRVLRRYRRCKTTVTLRLKEILMKITRLFSPQGLCALCSTVIIEVCVAGNMNSTKSKLKQFNYPSLTSET